MFYRNQFASFDPLKGDVPDFPIAYLSEITRRARSLLRNWIQPEEIERMAKRASNEIDDFFSHALELKIFCLETDLAPGDEEFERYFEWDGGTAANGRWVFKEGMADDLGIPTEENTSDVDALKLVIEERDSNFFLPASAPEPEPIYFPEGKDYELFAVLSLCLLADAVEWTKRKASHSLPIANGYAIQAMNAVCYAEHLKEIDWIISYGKQRGENSLKEALIKQRTEYQIREQQFGSVRGKIAVSHRMDQQLKPQWEAHCKNAVKSGKAIAQLDDLFQIEGCSTDFKKHVDARTLKRWAKEATGIQFKPGRRRK